MHVLDALGNPVRRQIIERLQSAPLSVADLSATFPVSRPAISRHLRILEEAGLVRGTAAGNRNLYALSPHGFAIARGYLDAFWDESLANLQALARE